MGLGGGGGGGGEKGVTRVERSGSWVDDSRVSGLGRGCYWNGVRERAVELGGERVVGWEGIKWGSQAVKNFALHHDFLSSQQL